MSKQDIDYKYGGTYFVNKKNKIYSKKHIDIGDVGIFYASMIHIVDAVNIFQNQTLQMPEDSGLNDIAQNWTKTLIERHAIPLKYRFILLIFYIFL